MLKGENILFDSVKGQDTPDREDAITCVGCRLNFVTGNNITEGPNTWTFAAGGEFTLTGGLNGSDISVGEQTLLSGSFDDEAMVTIFADRIAFTLGTGTDQKSEDLLNYYFGENIQPPGWTFGLTLQSLAGKQQEGDFLNIETGAFQGTVNEADITNTAVPLPAAAWLFGSGLVGLAGIARKRRAS